MTMEVNPKHPTMTELRKKASADKGTRRSWTKSGVVQISFKEYMDRMKEGQYDIFHIT